jgi:hypothetical protein
VLVALDGGDGDSRSRILLWDPSLDQREICPDMKFVSAGSTAAFVVYWTGPSMKGVAPGCSSG